MVFLAPFQSGSVYVYDVETRSRIATIPVEDAAGVVGLAVSTDGNSLYLVDGNVRSRLRRFDTSTWKEDWVQEFQDRLLALGATHTLHLTGDNRWVLIRMQPVGSAASPAVRVFDVQKRRFAATALPLRHCSQPLFANGRDGELAALCPGFLEMLGANPGEELSPAGESSIGIRQPVAIVMARAGEAAFVLGTPAKAAPWELERVALHPQPRSESWNLQKVLGPSAQMAEEPQPSLLALDDQGAAIAIGHGSRAWMVNAHAMRLKRAFRMSGVLAAAQFSKDGSALYTLERDDTKHVLLLGRTGVESGAPKESVLLDNLPLKAVVTQFVFVTGGSR
jgi:hypothetical protein